MNTNSNTVGGRKFGGRNKKYTTKKKSFEKTQTECQCDKSKRTMVDKNNSSNVSEFQSILKCLSKKMLRKSWSKTLANDTFGNRLISILIAVTVGKTKHALKK